MDHYHRIVMRYFAPSYPGPVVLLWPEHEPWGSAAAAAAAWRRLVPSVSVHVVPGDHLAVVHEHLDVLAGELAPYLDDGAVPEASVPDDARAPVHLALLPVVVDLGWLLLRMAELRTCLA
jgi:hypothetical protein